MKQLTFARYRVVAVLLVAAFTSVAGSGGVPCLGQEQAVAAKLIPSGSRAIVKKSATWEYRWKLTPGGPCRVSSKVVVIESFSPTPILVQGGTHGAAGNSACELLLTVQIQEDGSVKLVRGSSTDDSTETFNVEMPDATTRLVDQVSHFRPASLRVGEFRVLWEGMIHKGTRYAKRVQFVVGLLDAKDKTERFTPGVTQHAIRINSELDVTMADMVAEWSGRTAKNDVWKIDFKADGNYSRRDVAVGDQPNTATSEKETSETGTRETETKGTWDVKSNVLVLREQSGAEHNWTVVNFSIDDQRVGNHQLHLTGADGGVIVLARTAGDMRTGLQDREQIGTALGTPVFRDQIRGSFPSRDELHRLFSQPAMQNFRQANLRQITPTKEELKTAADHLAQTLRERVAGEYGDILRKKVAEISSKLAATDLPDDQRKMLETQKQVLEKSLDPTANQHAFTAQWMLERWKFQHFLYDKYGGGRVVWQQAGVEAFDAMHAWYKAHEAAGDFTIIDPKLKAEFYEYWTNEKMHGAFLTDDKERIRTTFLQPPWSQK